MTEEKSKAQSKKIALKDWHVVQNEIDVRIKKGDDVSDLPSGIIKALITEKVLKG